MLERHQLGVVELGLQGILTVEVVDWNWHSTWSQTACRVRWHNQGGVIPGDTGHIKLIEIVDDAIDGSVGEVFVHVDRRCLLGSGRLRASSVAQTTEKVQMNWESA